MKSLNQTWELYCWVPEAFSFSMFGSSPNLKMIEANYGVWGNNLASINRKLIKNGVNKVLFWWFMQVLSLFLILSRPNLFGSLALYLFGSASVLPMLPTILMSAYGPRCYMITFWSLNLYCMTKTNDRSLRWLWYLSSLEAKSNG